MPATSTRTSSGWWSRAALGAFTLASAAALMVPAGVRAEAAPASPSSEPTVGLFPDDAAPAEARLDADRSSVELGVRFQPNVDGAATGVQIYKASSSSAATPVSGTLWDDSGRRMATASFQESTETGWLSVDFAEDVELEANETYTVSVFAPNGMYAATPDYFRTEKATERLTAPAGQNGVYRYGSTSGFPTETFKSSNYWVDVAFQAADSSSVEQTAPDGAPAPAPAPTAPAEPSAPSTPQPEPADPEAGSGGSATPQDGFPTAATAGTPAGWSPQKSVTGDYWIRDAGAVVEDLKVTNGTIFVDAPNVTLRRIQIEGGRIDNVPGGQCRNGLVIEDSTIGRGAKATSDKDMSTIGVGGYTARNVKIDGVPEGFRVGGRSMGCGPVVIEDSYTDITAPEICNDWHGDGIQGYDGPALTVRNSTIKLSEAPGCGGTAAFFYPHSQGNTSVTIDGLLVDGGGFPFRLGMPGTVKNLNIVDGSWGYSPIDVKCSVLSAWDARTVRLDSSGQPTTTVREQACNTESGN